MDYWANADAVSWFAQQIFPVIRKQISNAQFYIVGARPSDAVRKLANKEGVHVMGSVEDIRPYIACADVIVAPMRIARGVQNKVLEAMAMERPVVVTSVAMEGIEKLPGQKICDDAESFIDYCLQLLTVGDTEKTAVAGRQRVLNDFNWDQNLVRLESLLGDSDGSNSEHDISDKRSCEPVQEAAL